ncbi:GNAT family N-acetyltransferase [Vibrio lamellibrachiae]|uniref:GNAT family N-acetyltransferase n=1 Tax=Vibrio lamellibrachiae TaxID=2910253 RepID=UPI003D0EEAF4
MKLVVPSIEYEESYIQMVREFSEQGEVFIPFVLSENYSDFPAMIDRLASYSRGEQLATVFVANSSYWLINTNEKVVGCSNLRHDLNDELLVLGGHIGYGIKPSERKKGYAKLILKLTLPRANSNGITKALLTVNKANLGSVKAIQSNGGVLEAEKKVSGQEGLVQYYWVET